MNLWEAVDTAAKDSGLNYYEISYALGKSRTNIITLYERKKNLLVDTAGKVLAACGYTLCAVKGEPPEGALAIDTTMRGERYADIVSASE